MFDETALTTEAFNTGYKAGCEEERKKYIDAMRAMSAKIEELEDKHWEECRQIGLYDDELKKAKALLKKLSSAEYTKHYDEETVAELFDYWEGEP